mgnify:CR=1 FL=1
MFVRPMLVTDQDVVQLCLKKGEKVPFLSIRDPDLRDFLPIEGREVPDSDYWQRRLRDKDVTSEPVPIVVKLESKK